MPLTFLVSWSFMSLSSCALVIAHHREPENLKAGYIYLVMASIGTLALLLAFGALAGANGGYSFEAIRAISALGNYRRCWCSVLRCPRCRIQSRPCSAAYLAPARSPGSAKSCVGANERRDDQSCDLRLRAHRVRSARRARLVVEHAGARGWRHHCGNGRALRTHAARSQAAARLSHRRKHRHHLSSGLV